jgi:hypothetical protein
MNTPDDDFIEAVGNTEYAKIKSVDIDRLLRICDGRKAALAEKESLAHDRGVIIDSQLGQIAALEEREEDLVRNCARANAEKDILQTERDKWKAKCTCIVPDDYDADYANKIFGDRYGYDWEYRGVTTLKATIAEKEELIKKWRLACEAGTDAHKRYCDEIAAFTEKNEEIKDDMARAILAMNDQVFLIAALTARIKELTEALGKIVNMSENYPVSKMHKVADILFIAKAALGKNQCPINGS